MPGQSQTLSKSYHFGVFPRCKCPCSIKRLPHIPKVMDCLFFSPRWLEWIFSKSSIHLPSLQPTLKSDGSLSSWLWSLISGKQKYQHYINYTHILYYLSHHRYMQWDNKSARQLQPSNVYPETRSHNLMFADEPSKCIFLCLQNIKLHITNSW